MTLPVSKYEELLAHVRSLTSETIQLRQEITSSLSDYPETRLKDAALTENESHNRSFSGHQQRKTDMSEELAQSKNDHSLKFSRPSRPTSLFTKVKECEVDTELKEVDEQRSSPDKPNDSAFHRSDWGPESLGLWHSGPSSLSLGHSNSKCNAQQDLCNDVAFTASVGFEGQPLNSFTSSTRRAYSHMQLEAKVEMVYSLLSMLGTSNRNDMSKTLLAMSSSPESCLAMRQSGCLPLLIQLIHSPELDVEVRCRAAEALQNIVLAQTDEKKRRREARVLKLLQQIREYCNDLKVLSTEQNSSVPDEPEKHPVSAMEALMKFSFDAEHRQAMCSLGGLHAIAELIQLDHEVHGSMNDNPLCITLRRYAGMALTNLIFGDGNNKALLCSFNKFMRALVSQLMSPSEDLRQVTASVLRNLSWRADSESKQALRDIGAVTALMVAAMEGKKESTLKSILSALWNLSGHCSMNKVDVCAVPGAVAFLVKMLKYKAASNTLAVVENAGGILRNISSHIAVREDYRQILRDNNCFEILLEQLKSSSLTIVSNACGTLWNLSARCTEDQRKLWEMGAISMLRSLIQSKHKMISMGSSAALKNLLSANPGGNMFNHMDSTAKSLGLQNLPTLFVRKQRALEQELDINLAETCDNIEPSTSPVHSEKNLVRSEERRSNISKRSDSHESVTSTQSDSAYERVNQLMVKNENKILENKNTTMHGSLSENQGVRRADEQKLMRRYKSSMIPTPAFKRSLVRRRKTKRQRAIL
ncbi:UNVERIFIED_CONTAM: hypothetical protein PYX00_008355 [Menopon gallinae]|uniref:Adenomatous polyposis coli protein n=1 Tax=Menopon gallinae TaxID=328185 RepID=A0AAW2HMT8_9NEOP